MSEHSKIQTCCQTGDPVCRRIFNMNLALGYTEEFYSLPALAQKHNMDLEEMFEFAYDYVQARDCFAKEWRKMKTRDECPMPDGCLVNKCFNDSE